MRTTRKKSADFLLEIGTEEIPASYLLPASEQMKADFGRFLTDNSLTARQIVTLYTPRRLALIARRLSTQQGDRTVQVLGPPARHCFDQSGSPTKALIGFARSHGLKPDQIKMNETDKGTYACAEKTERGRSTYVILQEYLPDFIKEIRFPKSMWWSDRDFRFARPIRWILALHGPRVIRFTAAGIRSANFTYGNRPLYPNRIAVQKPSDYVQKLRHVRVLVDPAARLSEIESGVVERAAAVGGKPVLDRELMTEVSNLVEYPLSVLGSFDSCYLKLPPDVILTAMKTHQRYFGVVNQRGKLVPHFVAVVTGDKNHAGEILEGNQKVLQARLADALFYWDADTKTPLGDRIDSLKDVVWLENMGTLYDKSERLVRLSTYTATVTSFENIPMLKRAAWLSKADLVTSMIKDGKEFTTLEGKIGMEYALHAGESRDVATAIHEHYLPRYPGDTLPKTRQGSLLSIADKLDTIVGGFVAGYVPTGSQDPQALRRCATGVIAVIGGSKLSLSLRGLVAQSIDAYKSQKLFGTRDDVEEQVLDFFKARVENWLQEQGFRYDLVDAVLSSDYDDPCDVKSRVSALRKLHSSSDFIKLITTQKRVTNILRGQPEPPALRESLLVDESEFRLLSAIKKLEPKYRESLRTNNYSRALRHLLSLRVPIDRFFGEVLVMAEEKRLRMNRLALLKYTQNLFSEIGDLSKIVVE